MARLPIDKARLSRVAGRSVARYIDFVHRTSRIVTDPVDVEPYLAEVAPAIVAVWHGQFFMAPKVKPLEVPLAIILARHGDAELFADSLTRFNTTLIRGAGAGGRKKDRGGASALRAAIRTLDSGISVGMSPDMPPGPSRRSGLGIVTLAAMSGRPIVPLATASSRFYALDTWSRFTINLPYGTLASVFGKPIYVARDSTPEQMEAARREVEVEMNRATYRAYALAGADMRRTLSPSADWPDFLPREVPPAPGVGLKTYSIATRLLRPAVPLLLRYREKRGKEEAARRNERLGIAVRPRLPGQLIWLHAASVGELNAVLPLADALRRARPGLRFLFTTGTVTSARIAERRLNADDVHQYVPLDAKAYLQRFLTHWRPDAAILTESEIWPNTILACHAHSVPLALVNGRISARSFSRWRKRPGIAKPLYSRFQLVLAQNEEMAQRFRDLGAPKVLAVGNLKIDAQPPPVDAQALAQLKAALGNRPFYVAASTHEGEEKLLGDVHRLVSVRLPGLCTVIAPRHPERGIAIGEMLKAAGLKTVLRSAGELPGPETDVYIADTIGELGTLYAASPIAFIGGSLVPHGGQNPIEAVRHQTVVLSGPHWFNFTDAYETLRRFDAVVPVSNAEELSTALMRLIDNESEIARLRSAAAVALDTLAGALDRSVEELLRLVPAPRELVRAGS